MSNDTSSKYEFSFPISGQQKNCYFDVRSLMCTGVPKSYDDKLVVKERIKHLELIFDYISDRSNSAKRNMYNYFKQYVLWAESKSINPFSSDAIKLFGETEFTVKHRRCINRFGALNILNEQSYLEYCQLNRGRELDLKIGDTWPLANHQWRRTFATMSLRFDLATLPAIKRQFKHISLQMTEWYTNYARITRNEDTHADAELNKLIHDVQNEMSTDVLFEAYNGNEKFAGGKGKEILHLRNDGGVPEIYRERSAIKAMLEQGKISLKFAGLNYCTNGYRCDQDGVVNAAFCVDCKSSIIDAKIAKKWKHLHERCVGHLEFSFDCGEVSPVSYAHFTSQIRAAEHVMDQFGIQYEKFQELS